MIDHIDSTSDERVVNNAARHQYRVLTDAEKFYVKSVKDKGLEFLRLLDNFDQGREVVIARERIEEAVMMWAVRGITA